MWAVTVRLKQAVRESATISPRPLQVDLWPFDLESGVRVTCDGVTWATAVPILVFLGLSFPDLRFDVRDRQTDGRQTDRRQTPIIA